MMATFGLGVRTSLQRLWNDRSSKSSTTLFASFILSKVAGGRFDKLRVSKLPILALLTAHEQLVSGVGFAGPASANPSFDLPGSEVGDGSAALHWLRGQKLWEASKAQIRMSSSCDFMSRIHCCCWCSSCARRGNQIAKTIPRAEARGSPRATCDCLFLPAEHHVTGGTLRILIPLPESLSKIKSSLVAHTSDNHRFIDRQTHTLRPPSSD